MLVDAERRDEPKLVLAACALFPQVPDFPGKDTVRTDLEGRAQRQAANFARRDGGELTGSTLDGATVRAVAEASDDLYRLEKRLLDRFPRERTYVRSFFLDVSSPRKKPVPAGS